MKNQYQEAIKQYYKQKDWTRLNNFIANCADKIDFAIPTRVANQLTYETIIQISCKHKAFLNYLPEYKDVRGIIIDFMKDGKLDKEYKRPSVDTMIQIFSYMKAQDCTGYGILLLNELGLTKEEYIKAYNKNKYNWLSIFSLASGFKFRPKDQDIRKMYSKTKDDDLLYRLSKYTDKEVQALFNSYNLDTTYNQIKYMSRNLSKFSNKAMLYALLKFYEKFRDKYANNTNLATNISHKLIKAEQKGLYEIIKYLYSEPIWGETLIKYNKELSFLKDENLDVILSCIPDDKRFEYILNYFNITQEDLDNWNIK